MIVGISVCKLPGREDMNYQYREWIRGGAIYFKKSGLDWCITLLLPFLERQQVKEFSQEIISVHKSVWKCYLFMTITVLLPNTTHSNLLILLICGQWKDVTKL
jgi:hypothetical protein